MFIQWIPLSEKRNATTWVNLLYILLESIYMTSSERQDRRGRKQPWLPGTEEGEMLTRERHREVF